MCYGREGLEQNDGLDETEQREKCVDPLPSFSLDCPGYTNGELSFKVEFATVGKTKDGKIYHHLWNAEEIDALLREQGLAKVDDEPEAGDIK